MDPHVRELLDLLVRWVHLIAGIMWVGNSMLFNWLDRNLIKPAGAKAEVDGEIWMLHSGGFYHVVKQQLSPDRMPAILHWFKWQSYSTWISGMFLLAIVYYLGDGAFMVDPSVSAITPGMAIAVGLGTLAGGWLLYDLLWRSPLGKGRSAIAISLVLVGGIVFMLTQLLSGRAAYIHVGALLGTLMAGNVFFHIIPSQRQLVAATERGEKPDPAIALQAKKRSIHNNYMTFPLLFIMVSNHFPGTFAQQLNWLILGVVMVAGATARHWLNIRFVFPNWRPALATTVVVAIALLIVLMNPALRPFNAPPARLAEVSSEPVAFAEARAVIAQRCTTCHSATPSDPGFPQAPAGVTFDTPDQIARLAERIKMRAVLNHSMPLGNKTGMTPEERALLGRWIAQGAGIQ